MRLFVKYDDDLNHGWLKFGRIKEIQEEYKIVITEIDKDIVKYETLDDSYNVENSKYILYLKQTRAEIKEKISDLEDRKSRTIVNRKKRMISLIAFVVIIFTFFIFKKLLFHLFGLSSQEVSALGVILALIFSASSLFFKY